jgi:hypothetical protein
MALPRLTRSLLLISGLTLVLAGVTIYYAMQRNVINQNLLITIIPSHYSESQIENENVFLKWEHGFLMEFQDVVNQQTAETLQGANESLTDLIIKLDKSYIRSKLGDVLDGKLSVIAYQTTKISISREHQQQLQMYMTAYCGAFEKLCARPMMRYWTTQYGGRDLPPDTLFMDFNPVLQNLRYAKKCIPKNGIIILNEATYLLDNLSPDDLTLLIDHWFSINNRLIHSYDEIFQQSSDFIQANYVSVTPHHSR